VSDSLSIAFEGAARTVTGSRHHVRFGARQWLFDCGLFQGHRDDAERINRTFSFAPETLDAVVVSHAHLDHTGNLPTLVARGYRGSIHATPATAELCRFMLADSAFLQEKDVAHVNRRAGGQPPRQPLYTAQDVEQAMTRFVRHEYHQAWDLFESVQVRYYDAGHILGSALTVFEFEQNGRRFRLGMSGDLGRRDRPILMDPEIHPAVDALVLESTYGNRIHPPQAETERRLAELIDRTVRRGGRVIVPAFAVGRTQEIVATIHRLCESKQLCDIPIFVDSPMARQATEVFTRHPELFDDETRRAFENDHGAPLGFARHGTRKQKNGAAKHQCIRHVIKAIVKAGAFHYSDRHVDNQFDEEHGQAQPRRCCAGFLANKQQGTRGCVNHGRQVRPNGVSVDVLGSHRF